MRFRLCRISRADADNLPDDTRGHIERDQVPVKRRHHVAPGCVRITADRIRHSLPNSCPRVCRRHRDALADAQQLRSQLPTRTSNGYRRSGGHFYRREITFLSSVAKTSVNRSYHRSSSATRSGYRDTLDSRDGYKQISGSCCTSSSIGTGIASSAGCSGRGANEANRRIG